MAGGNTVWSEGGSRESLHNPYANVATMNINKSDMVAQIVTLPRKFQALGNVSMFSLLEATGYFKLRDQISEDDIRTALLCRPECVQEWIQYSEDKRISSGWYATKNDEGCYETGYIADVSTPRNRVQYEGAVDACASFIKHEIDEIRVG